MQGELARCPGLYCGRSLLENSTWSDCGFCERGTRVNASNACAPCQEELSLYSWLYLGFMAMLPLIMHCLFFDLDVQSAKLTMKQLILSVSALLEVALSALLALLLMPPIWQLRLDHCGVRNFSDWYTLFYNPRPDYKTTIYCTQEAVYPLHTIVLVFFLFCLVSMFIMRALVFMLFNVSSQNGFYAALYCLPLLFFLHAIGCGFIYYAFPYLSIGIAMISNAIHYSHKLDQSMRALLRTTLTEPKNIAIIVIHWSLLAYGIFALNYSYHYLLCLVPFPSVFYILTVRFTDPSDFRDNELRPI